MSLPEPVEGLSLKPLHDCHVLVTPPSFGRGDPELISDLERSIGRLSYNTTAKPLDSRQLRTLLPGVDGYIAGSDTIDRAALEAADSLRVIARYGSGVDLVDLAAARDRNIVVAHTPGANTVSIAELAVGLILSLARGIPGVNAFTKGGGWPRVRGLTLEGKHIGLLGFGSVGSEVARRLQGFDCHLISYDPYPDKVLANTLGVRLVNIEDLVRQSDFLSLHLSVLPETEGMVDAAFLALMKQGAYLINTASGELIVEADLLAALQAGRIRGAALDVFTSEPPGAHNPLLTMPQVIATPHTGAHTDGATRNKGWGALEACLAVLQGYEPANRVV